MGSDTRYYDDFLHLTDISIHAPRMGSDTRLFLVFSRFKIFQSTLPAWGATPPADKGFDVGSLISIHAPRMGSDTGDTKVRFFACGISIHAPRMGSDTMCYTWLPTHRNISIHAPRMGSDTSALHLNVRVNNISIHAPRMGSDTVQSKHTAMTA